MSRQAKRELRGLVGKWADRLGLDNWRIRVDLVRLPSLPASAGKWGRRACARASFNVAYRQAVVSAEETVWDRLPPAERERTACHETLHIVISPLMHVAEQMMADLPKGRREVYEKWLNMADEQVTEQLAAALVGRRPKKGKVT